MANKMMIVTLGALLALPVVSMADGGRGDQSGNQSMAPIVLTATRANPTITVDLTANQSTGYNWYLSKANDDLIERINRSYMAGGTSNGAGDAAGKSIWKITLDDDAFDVPQMVKLRLVYANPSQTEAKMTKQTVIIFTS